LGKARIINKEDEHVKISIQNMKCAGCASTVTEALLQLPGVEKVSVDLDAAAAEIEGAVDMELLKSTLAALGYPVKEG
jgi:copper chaperone CopZ